MKVEIAHMFQDSINRRIKINVENLMQRIMLIQRIVAFIIF